MEKGKTPLGEPKPLPSKKRRSHRRDIVMRPEVSRPWYEWPPLGYPFPLYAQAEGSGGGGGERRHPRCGRGRRAVVTHAVAPGAHAADSSRELVMWAAMPPRTWIRFPQFFSAEMPPRGPLELWLQHADCDAPATGAEVEAISSGKIFMT